MGQDFIQIICDVCGAELTDYGIKAGTLFIAPCEACMENEYKRGEKDGYQIKEDEDYLGY